MIEEFSYNYTAKIDAELNNAPPKFLNAIESITTGNIENSISILRNLIPEYEQTLDYWLGTVYCCYGYCLNILGYWKEALENAERGEKYGLSLIGYWYYYSVMVNASNYVDNIDKAKQYVDEAVEFYRKKKSGENVSYFLESKANIYKQIAYGFSNDLTEFEEAKKYIIEAIYALCESIYIVRDGWEKLSKELEGLSNIAARVGLTRKDLGELNNFQSIQDIISPYFDDKILRMKTVAQNHNLAINAIKAGNRDLAVKHYEFCLTKLNEKDQETMAMRVFILYQLGVCLLILHNLGNTKSIVQLNTTQKNSVKRIQKLWTEAMEFYEKLSRDTINSFNQRFPPGLDSAIKNIRNDFIMRIN